MEFISAGKGDSSASWTYKIIPFPQLPTRSSFPRRAHNSNPWSPFLISIRLLSHIGCVILRVVNITNNGSLQNDQFRNSCWRDDSLCLHWTREVCKSYASTVVQSMINEISPNEIAPRFLNNGSPYSDARVLGASRIRPARTCAWMHSCTLLTQSQRYPWDAAEEPASGMRVHNNLFRALLLRTTAVGPGPVAVKYAWVFYTAETSVIMSSPVLRLPMSDGMTVRVDKTFLR